MARRSFLHRAESFGFETTTPWALPLLRLVFNVPRTYRPLAEAWDYRHPGTLSALTRLTDIGFIAHQAPLIFDTKTMQPAPHPERAVTRYRTTNKGHLLVVDALEDLRALDQKFPRLAQEYRLPLLHLLDAFDLDRSHSRFGLSARHAIQIASMPERNGRWWVDRLVDQGYLRVLPEKVADVREIIPEHWRPTRTFCRQLEDVFAAFPQNVPPGLAQELRLKRTRFLADVDPARMGISGSTDYDHDIEAQSVLAQALRSQMCAGGIFAVEPRIALPINESSTPWVFSETGKGTVFYQPDAELRERDEDGLRRSVIEYERYQSRKDAWSHIERFLGWMHCMALPSERGVLRFVVDSSAREKSYVALIEAFADYAFENTHVMPKNNVMLAVTSRPRLAQAKDALDHNAWFRIHLPSADTVARPVLHAPEDSPYKQYFNRLGAEVEDSGEY